MIWFEEQQSRKKLSRIFFSYETTFPKDERRNKEQFLSLLDHPDVYIFSIKNDETPIGYLILWEFDDFHFLEHFEVFEEFRNKNYGSEILSAIVEKFPRIILESEPADLNEISQRRISFYERNGYSVLNKNYIQPSYGEDKNPLQLWLMSNFPVENTKTTIEKIHKKVYFF